MPKTIPAGFAAKLENQVTSWAYIWILTRTDGQVFRFTSNSKDIVHDFGLGDGVQTYVADNGFSPSAFASTSGLDVDNSEGEAVFSDSSITKEDLENGLFDHAEIRSFIFDHQDLAAGIVRHQIGFIGEVNITTQGLFTFEFRSIGEVLKNNVGELYSVDCRADLGDARCRFPIKPDVLGRSQAVSVGEFYRVVTAAVPDGTSFDYEDRIYEVTTAGTTDASQPAYTTTIDATTTDGTAVLTARDSFARAVQVSAVDSTEPNRKFSVTELTPNTAFPDDWFNFGAITFETGDNAGRTIEVRDFVADDGVTIVQDVDAFLQLPFNVQVGDVACIYAGCDKRLVTCRTKFSNELNFVGEPNIPGTDYLARTPDAPPEN